MTAVVTRALGLGVAITLTLLVGAAGELAVTSRAAADSAPLSPSTRPAPTLGTLVLPSLGAHYRTVTQGPLTVADVASYSPNPLATARALHSLSTSSGFATYLRAWSTTDSRNGVIDLVVRFPNSAAATSYLRAERHTLTRTPQVQRLASGGVPGAAHYSYLVNQPTAGVGQLIDFAQGRYVTSLTFNSAHNQRPRSAIAPVWAEATAQAQYQRLTHAASVTSASRTPGRGLFVAGWLALLVALLALVGLGLVVRSMRKREKNSGEATAG